MGKKRWAQEHKAILDAILEYCTRHANAGTSIRQEPYKKKFYNICLDAYNRRFCGTDLGFCEDPETPRQYQCAVRVTPLRPQICADTIWQYAEQAGLVSPEMDAEQARKDKAHRVVNQVMAWWAEWVYAWEHEQPHKRAVRRWKNWKTCSLRCRLPLD